MNDNKKFWDRCAKFYTFIQQGSNRRLYGELASMAMAYLTLDQ